MRIKSFDLVGESILVRQQPPGKVGSIIIPEKFAGQRMKYLVEAVGPDVTRCSVGDYVVLSPSARSMDADPNDSNLLLMEKQDYVVARVTYEEESALVTLDGATIQ